MGRSKEIRILVSDQLIGRRCPDKSVTFISRKNMGLRESRHLIKRELKSIPPGKKVSVLMSVGSFHATAAFNGWTEKSIKRNEVKLFKQALTEVKEELCSLENLSIRFKCKILICSPIPLPKEQDCSYAAQYESEGKQFLTDLVSKLFVEISREVDTFNRRQGGTTLMLHKFLECGIKQIYVTNQWKINLKKYEEGKPKKEIAEDLMERAVDRLNGVPPKRKQQRKN